MNLNPAQKQAVTHQGGPALVLAGAGSGKTGVITRRMAWLIDKRGVDPSRIVAVTFTNKAAREMKQRVASLLDGRRIAARLHVSTFHRLGLRILREECEAMGLTSSFSIVDPADARAIIADLLGREFNTDPGQADAVASALSAWRNGAVAEGKGEGAAGLERIHQAYQRHLRSLNAVDLDDMIALPRDLLAGDPEALHRWRRRAEYLLVDEYQDTNAVQYELVRLLAGSGRGLMAVGDDDQSIYAWRGAMPQNLGQLAVDYPDLAVIKLQQNYRSRGRILKLANHLIRNNPRPFEKQLFSELGYGDPVKVLVAGNEVREAERVVSELMSVQFQTRARYGDFAILYRSNHQSRVLEQKLVEMRLPYQLSGGQSFFDRTEVRDLMAYLKVIANPADDSAMLRIVNTPRRGIGASTLERVGAFARERRIPLAEAIHSSELLAGLGTRAATQVGAFSALLARYQDWAPRADARELIDDLLEEIGYRTWLDETCDNEDMADRRWQNVCELAQWVERVAASGEEDSDLAEAVRKLVLTDRLDSSDDDAETDSVRLMTLHAAKGLEFDDVFIVGLADDILPHANSRSENGVEEERRLFYVGITRARKRLVLSYATRRRRYGEILECQPSRFIEELPADDLDWRFDGDAPREDDRRAGKAHLAGIRAMLTG